MGQIGIVLFSYSTQFLNVTKASLESLGIEVKKVVNDLKQLEMSILEDSQNIYIAQLPAKDKNKSEKIMEFFCQKNLRWICVGEDGSENFVAMTKGAMAQIILKEVPTVTEFKAFIRILKQKIKQSLEIANILSSKTKKTGIDKKYHKIISIGASTGGTDAVQKILTKLEADIPPILVVIHMPPGFTRMYANRLNEICKMYVKEAKDGDEIKSGVVYIAPGGYQMRVYKKNDEFYLSCTLEDKVNGHIPSVDVLFESVAKNIAPNVVACILTGMGNDGALGILEIKKKGGYTIGQDEQTCIVYGMPKVAKDIGGVCLQASLREMPGIIMNNI